MIFYHKEKQIFIKRRLIYGEKKKHKYRKLDRRRRRLALLSPRLETSVSSEIEWRLKNSRKQTEKKRKKYKSYKSVYN